MADSAFLLIAHGSSDPSWAEPFRQLAQHSGAGLAFLDLAEPSIADAVDQAVAAGARTLRLLPLFMAVGKHVKRDIPAIVDELRARHPACAIELLPALGQDPAFWQTLRDFVAAQVASTSLGVTRKR
ncbi:sirohydrochlorin chelatase [Haliangium ochraceum]|uniref:Cobalamin (Vitamin B12) biosynthesis CbiX protein n=1 Tax=Haliangium ochraceum (strain DSM 14365 / JCM 11303 / SMP-2) TaxID=502025 RepID=D0LXK7_HALO1|nr:CbiX/SirB N-terminal domain-containing protein [Haliangium ochraceum]ACY17762.1 cobalamin (vitamin B12) biosynthesis CbiX protein [Haliangium ochraceum DSM 14365]